MRLRRTSAGLLRPPWRRSGRRSAGRAALLAQVAEQLPFNAHLGVLVDSAGDGRGEVVPVHGLTAGL